MNHYRINRALSGLGHELAKQLAKVGNIVIGTLNQNEPTAGNSNIHFHLLNVLDDNLSSYFLTEELAAFVYCQGSINLRSFERIKPSNFQLDYKLQVIRTIKLLQLVLSRLNKFANASIVLFSTVAVQTALAFHTQVSTFKVAIEELTRALSVGYVPHRVNYISPSLADRLLAVSLLNNEQKMFRSPLKRLDSAEDLADIAVFLLSQKAGLIT